MFCTDYLFFFMFVIFFRIFSTPSLPKRDKENFFSIIAVRNRRILMYKNHKSNIVKSPKAVVKNKVFLFIFYVHFE